MKKNHVGVLVEKNAFVDEGDGVISFPNKLVITDESPQRNGTQYDIESLDLSEYDGHVTADHIDSITTIIGKVKGVAKIGKSVVVDSIKFAVKENALARLAYDLMKSGFLTNFSIETYGSFPDDEGVYKNAKLIGLSAVVVGNNKNAVVNNLIVNSIEQAKKDGLDTTEVEKEFLNEFRIEQNHSTDEPKENIKQDKKDENGMKFLTIKNSREFPVLVSYKNASGEDAEIELAPNASIDVSEDQKEAVEKQINEAQAPKKEEPKVEPKTEEKNDSEKILESVGKMIQDAFKPVNDKMGELEQQLFNKGAQEPAFKKDDNAHQGLELARPAGFKKELETMDWRERHALQVNSAWEWFKQSSLEAAQKLRQVNEVNLEQLKKEGVVKNSVTIADFGNFVISRELLTEIEGCRNNYQDLVNATSWRETLSTQFAWLKRSGDIDMTNVEFCDDDADGNLKPISEYSASIETSDLEELAAVTPVCNAATRFLAVDLLADVAAGYRNDYDRKRAQLVVARLEQAVEENGNSEQYNTGADLQDAVDSLNTFMSTWAQIATCTPNGTFVFNMSTYAEIVKKAIQAGVNGPLASLFTTGNQPTIFGRPYILVPDDLMPSLNTAQTKSFVVDGESVTVNHAVFYGNLDNFTGRTSGGLQYDLSTEAAYEDGETVKSAYQRNELVLRGSFFRGGAILDTDQVAGIASPGVS